MPTLKFSLRAEAELDQIIDYIAADKPVAAQTWGKRIKEKCELLAGMPTAATARPDLGPGVRSSSVGRYIILFRPVENGIEVLRIVGGSQDVTSS